MHVCNRESVGNRKLRTTIMLDLWKATAHKLHDTFWPANSAIKYKYLIYCFLSIFRYMFLSCLLMVLSREAINRNDFQILLSRCYKIMKKVSKQIVLPAKSTLHKIRLKQLKTRAVFEIVKRGLVTKSTVE